MARAERLPLQSQQTMALEIAEGAVVAEHVETVGRALKGAARLVPFVDAEPELATLLDRFGPARGVTHPLYPFWYLKNDGLWELPRADGLPRRSGSKEPLVSAVRDAHLEGGFPAPIHELLSLRPRLVVELAHEILSEHFAESMHDDIADAVGLDLAVVSLTRRIPRPPGFRDAVLRAYGHRCAICGFQALLDGAAIGIEAAHVQWHAFKGPSTPDNGLALCVLHHKLLDLGVLGISPALNVLVSSRVSGDAEAARLVVAHAERPIARPQAGVAPISERFANWHFDQVFKKPHRAAV